MLARVSLMVHSKIVLSTLPMPKTGHCWRKCVSPPFFDYCAALLFTSKWIGCSSERQAWTGNALTRWSIEYERANDRSDVHGGSECVHDRPVQHYWLLFLRIHRCQTSYLSHWRYFFALTPLFGKSDRVSRVQEHAACGHRVVWFGTNLRVFVIVVSAHILWYAALHRLAITARKFTW